MPDRILAFPEPFMSQDPRDRYGADVPFAVIPTAGPDPIVITDTPVPPETRGSIEAAKLAQRRERDRAITDTLDEAATEQLDRNLRDSLRATQIADAFPEDRSPRLRLRGAQIGLRAEEAVQQRIARFHGAEAVCGALRAFLRDRGLTTPLVTEHDLRVLSDLLADAVLLQAVRTWTGERHTAVRTYAEARLGLLDFGETA